MFSCACLSTARMIDGFEPARIFLQGSFLMAFIIKDSMKVRCFPVVSSDQTALPGGRMRCPVGDTGRERTDTRAILWWFVAILWCCVLTRSEKSHIFVSHIRSVSETSGFYGAGLITGAKKPVNIKLTRARHRYVDSRSARRGQGQLYAPVGERYSAANSTVKRESELRDVVFFEFAVIGTAGHAQQTGGLGFVAIAFGECQLELFGFRETLVDVVLPGKVMTSTSERGMRRAASERTVLVSKTRAGSRFFCSSRSEGRSFMVMTSDSARTTARSMTFSNWRMLPGQ